MKHALLTTLFVLSVAVLPAFADEVTLVNGDRLSGAIDSIVGGKLQLRSPLLGTVEIDMIHVDSISSDQTVSVVLSDGRIVQRRLRSTSANRVQLRDEQDRVDQEVGFDQIAAVNPPPVTPPSWTGAITGGFTSIQGNTRSTSMQVGLNMSKRGEQDRTTLGADFGRATRRNDATGEDDTTENWWRANAKYDRFFSEKFYGYLEGRYMVDRVADLDRRIIGAAGTGYQWVETGDMSFSTELGLAHVTETYADAGTSDNIAVQAGYNFDKRINEILTFKHNLVYFPSTEQFSDYYLTTTFELRARLTERMFTNFRAIFDYDATPAPGNTSTDTKYILGVGWDF